jgi:hypothetical protein
MAKSECERSSLEKDEEQRLAFADTRVPSLPVLLQWHENQRIRDRVSAKEGKRVPRTGRERRRQEGMERREARLAFAVPSLPVLLQWHENQRIRNRVSGKGERD